jgi:hypothetical protein
LRHPAENWTKFFCFPTGTIHRYSLVFSFPAPKNRFPEAVTPKAKGQLQAAPKNQTGGRISLLLANDEGINVDVKCKRMTVQLHAVTPQKRVVHFIRMNHPLM